LASQFGLAQEEVNRPDIERRVIARLDELGSVGFDYDDPALPVDHVSLYRSCTDQDLESLRLFPKLKSLSLHKGNVTDAGLAHVASLSQLEFLNFEGESISLEGMALLAKLNRLSGLEFIHCTIAEEGLAHFANHPRLGFLSIRHSTLTDRGLSHIGRMPNLRNVDVSNTQVTNTGVARLKEALPYALIVSGNNREKQEYEYFLEFAGVAVVMVVVGLAMVYLLRRCSWIRIRTRIWKCVAVATAVAVVGFGLLRMAPVMCPVQEGDAGTFWIHVCEIDVGAKKPRRPMGGFYQPRDGWFIYYDQGFHGQFLGRVRADHAIALFPKLVEKLRKAPPGLLKPDVEQGFQNWQRTGADPNDAVGFLTKVREARLDRIGAKNPKSYEYARSEEQYFDERWARIGRYHWNIRFEFAFLTGLILFAAWPWFRNAGRLRWAIHLSVLPSLVCLPYWLGYATLTFTSAGASGGVLYPWLIAPLRGLPWSELDTMILRAIPHPLESLSQTPGPMLSLSGMGGVGPVSMFVLGFIIFAGIMWGPAISRELCRRFRNWRELQSGSRKDSKL
jgi:hypothetical protein